MLGGSQLHTPCVQFHFLNVCVINEWIQEHLKEQEDEVEHNEKWSHSLTMKIIPILMVEM